MRKFAVAIAACGLLCASLFAQAVNDNDTSIPLGEDLTGGQPPTATAPQAAATAAKATSSVAQGMWIEATGDNKFLTRDLATGEKSGYEFDKADFKSKGNWWFWGDLTPAFHLDAEISVWNFDNVMYKANSFGANIPDVTWGDGFQSLLSRLFAPVAGGSDDTAGALNKLGFTVATPYLQARLGYGDLEKNTMSSWTGIYNMLDYWLDVGKGFVEFTNGSSLREIGPVKLNALFALSRMRAEYGMYSVVDASVADKADVVLTWGSTSTESEVFRYDEQNDNAFSAYASVKPLDCLKVELHGMGTYGTGTAYSLDSSAAAARVTFTSDKYTVHAAQSFAGSAVATVWGDDDSVGVDGALTRVGQWFTVNDTVGVGLDTDFMMNGIADLGDGLWHLRNEPMVDLNLGKLLSKDVTAKFYGVVDVDRIALADSATPALVPYFEEAGVEIGLGDLALYLRKLVVDYAAYATYDDWSASAGYALDTLYHSVMVSANITDALGFNFASVVRSCPGAAADYVPTGFAGGVSLKTDWKGIGSPMLWAHATYGMDPYTDNNYTLYRYDDPKNKSTYRSYRLNSLYSSVAESHIRFGLIWDLK